MQPMIFQPWSWFLNNKKENQQELQTTPARMMSQMNRNLEQMFDQFFSAVPAMKVMEEMMPMVDIEEDEDSYTLKAQIPGLSEEDLDLHVKNGQIHISGSLASSQKRNKEEEERKVHQLKRAATRFNHSLALPLDADEEQIEAEFDRNQLRITVPKLQKSEKDKIKIEVNSGSSRKHDRTERNEKQQDKQEKKSA
jgi:HSP20 family protein